MTRVRIADRIAHAMIAMNYETVMWGDDLLNNASGDYVKDTLSQHPLDRMIAILNACERATDTPRPLKDDSHA